MGNRYDKSRVHRVNYFATVGIVGVFLIQILLGRGMAEFFKILTYALPILILTTIVYFLKVKDDISLQYGEISISFRSSNKLLDKERSYINQINSDFTRVQDSITNIAGISEEQSASTEEVLGSMEDQNMNIQNLTESLKVIDNLSSELSKLAEASGNFK